MADATAYNAARGQIWAAREALRAASTPTEKLNAATTLLRILGTAAANAPTEALRAAWLNEYRTLQPQAAALRAQVTDNPPGAVLQSLSKFSDAMITFSGKVLDATGDVVSGVGDTAKALPFLILALIVASAIVLVKIGPQLLGAYTGTGRKK